MKFLFSIVLIFSMHACASVQEESSQTVFDTAVRGDQSVGEEKTFHCTLEVSRKKYEAFGSTLLKTKKTVMDECRKNHSAVQCTKADGEQSCQKAL